MSYFAGVRGTGDFGADERPTDFRETIIFLNAAGRLPMTVLTDKKSEKLSDYQFTWWNERNDIVRLALAATATTTATDLTLVSGGLSLSPQQMLQVEKTESSTQDNEVVLVSSVTDDTHIVVKRAQFGTTGAALVTSVSFLTALGTAFGQNSAAPAPTSRNPTKYYNYTQIFRNTFGLSRTAKQTDYRTGDTYANDRRRKMFEHARDIEFALLFGVRSELATDPITGKPRTTTGGLRSFLTTNVTIFSTTPTQETFLNAVYPMFDWDSEAGDERIGICGNGFLNSLNFLAQNNTRANINHQGTIKVAGMELDKWVFPQGKVGFKTHPLMNRHARYKNSCFFLDPTGIRKRYMQDTIFQKDMQLPGTDGILDGWLTEAGLEVLTEETMAYIGNFVVTLA